MPEIPCWSVIVHGGCKRIRPERAVANRAGLQDAVVQAIAVLSNGGSALDAAEAAVRSMEANPTFNAGDGSVPRSDGSIEMDAAIMDGETLDIGAVSGLREAPNPIRAARALLRENETFIAGPAAARWVPPPEPEPPPEPSAVPELEVASDPIGGDTVGCVAMDAEGRIAAAVSTGGLKGAPPGRVGDSPLPGCGFYADSAVGGVVATGQGEKISRSLLAARAIFEMELGRDPEIAVDAALGHMARVGGAAGLIAIDAQARIGWKHNEDQFAIGWASSRSPLVHVEIVGLDDA